MKIGFTHVQNKGFPTTEWGLILGLNMDNAASNDALESLCKSYWPPIFAHLRTSGYSLHEAEDLTQEFFARLLAGNIFSRASEERGRFRTFLLASLKNFLINDWKHNNTEKRGGGVIKIDLDALSSGVRDGFEPCSAENIEKMFDKQWALTLLDKVRTRLRIEYEAAGQIDRYNELKAYLLEGEAADSYAQTAKLLSLSEPAVKSAIYKIRQRFGQLLRLEITRTLGDEGDVEDELRELIAAIGR